MVKKQQPGSDSEVRFLKKGGKTYFGYKKYILTDENAMLLSVHTQHLLEAIVSNALKIAIRKEMLFLQRSQLDIKKQNLKVSLRYIKPH